MKKALLDTLRKSAVVRLAQLSFAAAVVLSAGCRSTPYMPTAIQDLGPAYHPSNIYIRTNVMPARVQRVAVLPLTMTKPSSDLEVGVETLEPILYAELVKSKRFEVIPVSRQQMIQCTERSGWRAGEQLPPDLLDRVTKAIGADSILFCQITRYQPYQPLAVGW